MAQMQMQPQTNSESAKQIGRKLEYKPKLDGRTILLYFISFLLSHTVIFDVIAPFGLAFYAANYKGPSTALFTGFFVVLGTLAVMNYSINSAKYIIAMILFTIAYSYLNQVKNARIPTAVIAALCLMVTGFVVLALNSFVPYDIVMLLIECIICFLITFVMERAVKLMYKPAKRHIVLTEDAVSIYILISICIVGVSQFTLPWDISLSSIICALIILLTSLSGGLAIGSAIGVGCGLVGSFVQYPSVSLIGVYGLCGLSSGMLKRFGKAGVMFGFILANVFINVYAGGFDDNTFAISEQILALSLFWLVPKNVVNRIDDTITSTFPEPAYYKKIKDVMSQKLINISLSLENLAKALHKLTNWRQTGKNTDVTVVFDEAANRICRRCTNRFRCWQREFNTTYNALMHVVPVIKEYGSIKVSHLPEYFANRCLNVNEYVAEVNKQFDNYRVENIWHQKIDCSREMVTEQLYGISKIINNISKEVIAETQFDTPLEEELLKALNKKDIYPNDITVIKNANGRYEANLSINACMGAKVCDKIITPIFSMVTGTNMCKNNTDCATAKKSKQCYLQLTEQKRFSISCAAIRQAKDGQKINGDNYSTMPIKDGRYIMAISDGMGSGIDAASQSDTTVKLLEKFLHAGFDKSSAIKLINSVLLLRSSNETFATIDIALIDLFSGDAEFIKIGANTTYIKSGNKTERIISTSLPAGILGEVDIEAVRKKLHDNDFIIMLSDGVENVQDLWVEAYLSTITDTSPQLLANHLMRKAVERSGRIMDDMTILVGKVSKLI